MEIEDAAAARRRALENRRRAAQVVESDVRDVADAGRRGGLAGERMRVQRGETLALEHAGGPVRMGAELDVLLMRPPAAEA